MHSLKITFLLTDLLEVGTAQNQRILAGYLSMLLYSWLINGKDQEKKSPGKSWTDIGLFSFFISQDQKKGPGNREKRWC